MSRVSNLFGRGDNTTSLTHQDQVEATNEMLSRRAAGARTAGRVSHGSIGGVPGHTVVGSQQARHAGTNTAHGHAPQRHR